ncbi:MAG: FAD-dependent oxidoreductase [Lachnospiraceae bacterium]|nr:FAD-dependent oxidoreductase [Lachnospiraceae bacterium]
MKTVNKEFDVVVLGAGPGGLAAALAAGRGGAKVLLVEKNGYLGGNMAIGLPLLGFLDKDGNKVIGGIADEFMKDMASYETAYGRAASEHKVCPMHNSVTLYDHELFKIVALHKVLDAGIEVLFHTDIESVNVENAEIREITLRGKGYRIFVKAKIYIDASGDGDMAYLAGASYEKGQKDTGILQPPTMMFTLSGVDIDRTIDYLAENPDQMDRSKTIDCAGGYDADFFRSDPNFVMVAMRKLFSQLREQGKMPVNRENIIVINSLLPGEVHMNCTRHLGTDGSDVFSVTRAEIEGYLQIEKFVETLHQYVPGFEKCYISQIYPSLGIRESRRFSGIRQLTESDVVNGVFNEETIGIGSYCVDIHAGDGLSTIFTKIPAYGIPYGITVSDEIEGLMFAGRCASMDAVAMSSARVMPICMAIGEAAGVGAALAIKQGISPREVDVTQVRKTLLDAGAILSVNK